MIIISSFHLKYRWFDNIPVDITGWIAQNGPVFEEGKYDSPKTPTMICEREGTVNPPIALMF